MKFYRRRWLNGKKHHSTAFAYGDLELNDSGILDAEVKIADCDRVVSLDFSTWDADNRAERRNNVRKAKILAEFFADLHEYLVAVDEHLDKKPSR